MKYTITEKDTVEINGIEYDIIKRMKKRNNVSIYDMQPTDFKGWGED